jgi:acyl-[acyl-carrier-protein]-phospholipid O-acyltransferase/long-chain-fatty-acid--[acyl-carrier-protein] ligase
MESVKTKVKGFLLFSPFGFLNLAQILGAMNDNIIKLLIVFCFIEAEGSKSSNSILASVGAVYVMPFLLFSQLGGMMADRFPKRNIIISTKIMEIGTMCLALLAFFFVSKTLALASLFLLASHSALFGPCKYSIVPEIVPAEKISRANGILTSSTYSAIIMGTFLAAFLTDITNRHFIIAILVCIVFAFIGLWAGTNIPKTPAACPQRKLSPLFWKEFSRTCKIIRQEPSLFTAVISSAYFLFVGSFVQLNMIPYAMDHLALSDIQGGYLFLITALGIGAGSLLAGKFSGRAVELGLTPVGGIGMIVCCFLLDHFATNIHVVLPLILIVGVCGGFYLVPLDSYIQVTSPRSARGQILAMVNFLGFVGVLLSAATLYFLNEILELPPRDGFTIIGSMTILMVLALSMSISGYVVRFFSFCVSRLTFRIELKRSEIIPLYHPSFFFSPYPSWPWSIVLLTSQRRRMRLFSLASDENPTYRTRFIHWLLHIIEVDNSEALLPNGEYGEFIAESLDRGTSIAIFSSKALFTANYQKWTTEWKNQVPQDATPIPFFALIKPPTQEKSGTLHRDILQAEVNRIG